MTSAASHHCTSQANIAIENHQCITGQWWKDPVYRAIADAVIEGQPCEFCGKPATVAHHNEDWMYKSKEEYYNPANMTPTCWKCHARYRRGLVICPVCHENYMVPTNDACRKCRPQVRPNYKPRKKASRHPCAHRIGQQQCRRDGRTFICARSSKTASGCDYFERRKAPA